MTEMDMSTMSGIRVAVVIPAYNARNYIAQTLQSVIDQSHRALEIVIVDDGSTDDT
ncbi:glycosyltransferase family 2 protein, partial [Rhizobium johnstonii]